MDINTFVNNSEKIRLHRESGQNLHDGSDWTESENDHYRNVGYVHLMAIVLKEQESDNKSLTRLYSSSSLLNTKFCGIFSPIQV